MTKNKRFSALTAAFLCATMVVGTLNAAWTVVYDPFRKQTTVVWVPDNQPCPNSYYNPYNPYYRPYQPAPVYQFNFNKNNHNNHHDNHHNGGGHGKKHCK